MILLEKQAHRGSRKNDVEVYKEPFCHNRELY